ncbi:MAG: flagellar export protein FliJ [Gammaproteobacteria bacterium]|nr:flagellar export protein FliJ [Gammaproteobacteria bacterium]MDH3537820.1 flagellar export protein FliJ [Gammaproteobacteria bacterium]
MTRTQRLRPVVQHNDKKEKSALQEVARSQGVLEIEQGRLTRLQDYKLEYLQKKKYDIGVFTPIELQEFNRFMQQLDQTIARQMELVQIRQRELEQKRDLWQASRIDARKMHKVVEKLQRQEVTEQERREQKALDEFSQRKITRT